MPSNKICPKCGGDKWFVQTINYTDTGEQVVRHICRDCLFTESSKKDDPFNLHIELHALTAGRVTKNLTYIPIVVLL